MRPRGGPRHAGDQRPVELARLARLEGLAEEGGGRARAGDDQHAGRIAVEPMHELRLAPLPVGEGFQHGVDMARHARSALHGEAGRLVQHDHLRILVQDGGFEHLAVASFADDRGCALRARRPP